MAYIDPIIEINFDESTGLTIPLYLNLSGMTLNLTIARWWRLKKQGALEIDDAMRLIAGFINAYNKLDDIRDTRNKISFTPEYPRWLFDSDEQAEPLDHNNMVCWSVQKREPAALSSQPFGRPRELRPRIRENLVIEDAVDPTMTKHIEIKGQWFDNMVRFDCFAPTAKEANNLADTFEQILDDGRDYILRAGVQKMMYMGRESDRYTLGSRWYHRPVIFYFRTEQIRADVSTGIRTIGYDLFTILSNVNLVGL